MASGALLPDGAYIFNGRYRQRPYVTEGPAPLTSPTKADLTVASVAVLGPESLIGSDRSAAGRKVAELDGDWRMSMVTGYALPTVEVWRQEKQRG